MFVATVRSDSFFTTAAQVIPVLLLALFVERSAREGDARRSDSADALGVLLLLLMAEFTAFFALYDDVNATDLAKSVVILSIVIGIGATVLRPLREHLRRLAPGSGGLWIYLGGIAALAALTFAPAAPLHIEDGDRIPAFALGGWVLFVALAMILRTKEDWPTRGSAEPSDSESAGDRNASLLRSAARQFAKSWPVLVILLVGGLLTIGLWLIPEFGGSSSADDEVYRAVGFSYGIVALVSFLCAPLWAIRGESTASLASETTTATFGLASATMYAYAELNGTDTALMIVVAAVGSALAIAAARIGEGIARRSKAKETAASTDDAAPDAVTGSSPDAKNSKLSSRCDAGSGAF